ncbi:unnamed protein product [Musa acuminata subsp. malaccensis]|uniref:Mitochondrial import inner membrane translocase subunit n=1 Tax=Musa acuminata subsp. malaccensis TaxID=214687 RepID=A0A804KEN1_MUSAM|nr:unnamed protein product [Musa acuminata subsp. malaccensis]
MNRAWLKRASVNSSVAANTLGFKGFWIPLVEIPRGFPLFSFFVCFRFGFLAEATIDNSSDLQAFLKQEGQKAMIGQMVGKLTDQCWDKCISGTPGSKFSSKDSACLGNCARRFMDMSMLIMKKLQSMQ